MSKIYISGAITGLPFDEVKEKFAAAEELLTAQGHEVISPLKNGIPNHAPWEIHVSMDIILMIGCEAIYLLPDWNQSKGATLEKSLAELSGKEIIYQETPKFVELKEAIAEVTGISFYDIVGSSRARNFVYARMIFAQICSEQGAKIIEIAEEMKHNHSTIIYYLRKYADDARYNPKFRLLASEVRKCISKKK
jgi:hypothetical protein